MLANPALMELTDHPVLFFDGVCNLCNGFIDFVVKRDNKDRFRFAPLQGETARYALPSEAAQIDSFVLAQGGELYIRSTAALRVIGSLGGVWGVAKALLWIPAPIRDAVYRLIARNRYRVFGKRDSCRLPTEEEKARFMP